MRKRNLITLFLVSFLCLTALPLHAQESEWEPVSSWPFVYQQFTSADIYTIQGKKVSAKANIHVGQHYLWYESGTNRLAAKKGTISKVIFKDKQKSTYYAINDKLCRVLREDSINGKVARLYISEELDKTRYNEMVRLNQQATMAIMDLPITNGVASGLADREGSYDIDKEPLPMQRRFFMLVEGETFEATEHNILQHLSKEERKTYRSYTRSAEVLSGNRSSIENIWITFFVK